MKTYTARGNCARAAKASLGKDAKQKTDFNISKVEGGFQWHPVSGGTVEKSHPGTKAPLAQQPQMANLLKLITGGEGKTVAELQKAMGKLASHTVRGAVSRLRAQKHPIKSVREGRTVRYVIHKKPPAKAKPVAVAAA